MTQEYWNTFPKRQQLLMIGSEIARAQEWQKKDPEKFKSCLTRGIDLTNHSLHDPKWQQETYMLEGLRTEMENLANGTSVYDVDILYNAL